MMSHGGVASGLIADEEHHVVDLVLPELRKSKTDSEEFAAKARVLKDLVEHHANEEEKEMFPRARKLMTHEELLKLGERLTHAKRSLKTTMVLLVRP